MPNRATTTIALGGSIVLGGGCWASIEPIYTVARRKQVTGGLEGDVAFVVGSRPGGHLSRYCDRSATRQTLGQYVFYVDYETE